MLAEARERLKDVNARSIKKAREQCVDQTRVPMRRAETLCDAAGRVRVREWRLCAGVGGRGEGA